MKCLHPELFSDTVEGLDEESIQATYKVQARNILDAIILLQENNNFQESHIDPQLDQQCSDLFLQKFPQVMLLDKETQKLFIDTYTEVVY